MNRILAAALVVMSVLLVSSGILCYQSTKKNGELTASLAQRDADIKSLNDQLETEKKDRDRIDKIISALDDTKAANEARSHEVQRLFLSLRTDKQISACLDLRLPDGFVVRLRTAAGENTDTKTISAGNSAQGLPQAGH